MHRMTRREPTPIRPIRVGDPTARPLDSFRSIGADRQQLSCGSPDEKEKRWTCRACGHDDGGLHMRACVVRRP